MRLFSLDPDSRKPVRKYSLGMKQKLGIIQAIMEDQKLLILDEPFNALDEGAAAILRTLLLRFREEGRLRDYAFKDGRYVDMLMMSLLRFEWRGGKETAPCDPF